jgi:hypothetical protein
MAFKTAPASPSGAPALCLQPAWWASVALAALAAALAASSAACPPAALSPALRLPSPATLTAAAAAAAATSAAAAPVTLVGTAYLPSAAEREWVANIGEWHKDACARVASPQWHATYQGVVSVLAEQDAGGEEDGALPPALRERLAAAEQGGLLSHLRYTYSDGSSRSVALEPLIGLLRDHRASCQGEPGTTFQPGVGYWEMVVDKKMWVVMDPAAVAVARVGAPKAGAPAPRAPAYARALMFDMGGSRFMHAQGGRWILRQYARAGLHFDHVYVWEAAPTSSAEYFAGAPEDALHRVHFFNWPVAPEEGSAANPFTLVKRFATPEDFVVVKLDIDTPSVEGPLARQLLEDTALQALVDVFFFEHHVHINDFKWPGGMEGTLVDSYDLFRRLREAGIAAHSWP